MAKVVKCLQKLKNEVVVYYFRTADNYCLRAMVIERQFDTYQNQMPCYITVYDPYDWSIKIDKEQYVYKDGKNMLNIYSAISKNNSKYSAIYGTDYTLGRIFQLKYESYKGKEKLSLESFYEFEPIAPDAKAYSIATAMDSKKNVYALAQQSSIKNQGTNKEQCTHYPSTIAKLDNNLNLKNTAVVAPKAFGIHAYGDGLYITAAFDDIDDTTSVSRIQKVTTDLEVTDVFSPDLPVHLN